MTTPLPTYPPYPYRPPSVWGGIFRFMMGTLFGVSVGLNLLVLLFVIASVSMFRQGFAEDTPLTERLHAGHRSAGSKVAVIRIEGVILEGMMEYAKKQIERAAADEDVKAVVVRINSPGGSITASDEIYHRLTLLRDGKAFEGSHAKPLVVSMGSLAASGGYYIAMPAKKIIAERTSVTGSIGVYAAFPNIKELADKWGVKMEVIKRGEVKDSGSMFHNMTPPERQLWQDLIDHAYDQFLDVVRDGRGEKLKYGLRDAIPTSDAGKDARRLADGGVFTAAQAEQYGLIDGLGYLEDATAAAAREAGLGQDFKVVTYDRPRSLLGHLFGLDAAAPSLDVSKLAEGAMPRIWYLAPESGLAGFLSASR